MRRLTIVAVAIAALAVVAAPASAAGTRINVPKKFKNVLPKVKQHSGLQVRLPNFLDVGIRPRRVHASGAVAADGTYRMELGVGRKCNGSNACFVGAFRGDRGAKFNNTRRVKLARGIRGRYNRGFCGAYCGPASIEWKQRGVLYGIEVKGSKSKMIRLANQAIRAGAR